jgi:tetratricopeptide (TPR) repeat protein
MWSAVKPVGRSGQHRIADLLELRSVMFRRVVPLALLMVASYGFGAALPEPWIEARSGHFRVLTDSNEKQARHLLDEFERMRWMFHTLFPNANVDPVEPIVVLAARNRKSFQALEPAAYLEPGQMKLSGLFMRVYDKNYVLLRLDAVFAHPFASVYHEYTHLQFSQDAAWMPLWLNEGLAEFIQNTEIRNKDVWLGEPSPENILYLRQSRLIPLPVLFKVDRDSPYYHEERKGSVFYSESWALTHYLEVTDSEKATHRIDDYVKLVSHHEDPIIAAEKAFGNLNGLQNALESYIQASSYKQFVLSSAAARIDESAYKVRMLPQSESDAIRADVLIGVEREKEGQTLVDAVLKADPNNAQAHETMGALQYRAGHPDAALKWYSEAVKLSSVNYFAYFNFANLAMSDGKGWDDPSIENALRTAIKLNPRFYPASEFLATLLGSLNRHSDAIAVMQNAQEVAASPLDAAKAKAKIARLEQMEAERKSAASSSSEAGAIVANTKLVMLDLGPKHPTEPANGPKHIALGAIRRVRCSDPAVIEFRLEGANKSLSLYSNDYLKIEFTARGFTPEGAIHPCDDLEGMKVRVQYAESSDKTVDGQVITVELRK